MTRTSRLCVCVCVAIKNRRSWTRTHNLSLSLSQTLFLLIIFSNVSKPNFIADVALKSRDKKEKHKKVKLNFNIDNVRWVISFEMTQILFFVIMYPTFKKRGTRPLSVTLHYDTHRTYCSSRGICLPACLPHIHYIIVPSLTNVYRKQTNNGDVNDYCYRWDCIWLLAWLQCESDPIATHCLLDRPNETDQSIRYVTLSSAVICICRYMLPICQIWTRKKKKKKANTYMCIERFIIIIIIIMDVVRSGENPVASSKNKQIDWVNNVIFTHIWMNKRWDDTVCVQDVATNRKKENPESTRVVLYSTWYGTCRLMERIEYLSCVLH